MRRLIAGFTVVMLVVALMVPATGHTQDIQWWWQRALNTFVSMTAAEDSAWVHGPASATDGNLVKFDGTTGKLVQDGPTDNSTNWDDIYANGLFRNDLADSLESYGLTPSTLNTTAVWVDSLNIKQDSGNLGHSITYNETTGDTDYETFAKSP